MFFEGDQPVGCLPMTRADDMLCSHAGLTFGGIVCRPEIRLADYENMMALTIQYAKAAGMRRLIYKPTPHIYHQCPSEEDVFCLRRLNAAVIRTDLNTVIDLNGPRPIQERRKRGARSAEKAGVQVELDTDRYSEFWQILTDNLLERHQLQPVHTVEEILLLKSRFPDSIQLHVAVHQGQVVSGVLVFDSGRVVHAQYIAASPSGRELHALDLLFLSLLDVLKAPCHYFSFGISTYNSGQSLNTGLLEQKEGFGGRTLIQEWYELTL